MDKGQKNSLDRRYDDAVERYRIAQNNDMVKGMQESLNEMERQRKGLEEEIRQNEERLAKLKRLQIKLSEILPWMEEFLNVSAEDKRCLGKLAEREVSTEKKVDVFVRFADMVGAQDKLFATDEVHIDDQIKRFDEEIRIRTEDKAA